jgi:iron complex transport system substrate-binding protein
MQRRAFIGGSLALAASPILGKALTAAAHDATPEASPMAAPSPQLPITFTDGTGAEVTVTDVSRIIPLNGDIAEVIWALGLGGNVVAADVSATYPPEAQQLPSIGYQLALNAEAILSFSPTVVIGRAGFIQPVEVVDQIQAAGVPVVLISIEDNIETPAGKVRLVAEALGIKDAGEALAGSIEQQIADAETAVANVTEKPRVLFLLFRAEQGIQMVGGSNTPLDAILPAAGAINAGADAGVDGYQPLTAEAVVAAAPDIIILQQGGYDSIGGESGLLEIPGVAETPAGENKKFFGYDDQLLLGLGPRTGDLLEQLIHDFHPELAAATPTA